MKEFKFLHRSKRPILDSVLTEDELTYIREYCVDIARGESGDDLLRYFLIFNQINCTDFKKYLTGESIITNTNKLSTLKLYSVIQPAKNSLLT